MNKINEYKNKFPFGMEEFIRGLSTDKRLAIARLLCEYDALSCEKIVQYLDIIEDTGITQLDLDVMSSYGIIARTQNVWNGETFTSKYKLNKIYKKLIESCIDVLEMYWRKRV